MWPSVWPRSVPRRDWLSQDPGARRLGTLQDWWTRRLGTCVLFPPRQQRAGSCRNAVTVSPAPNEHTSGFPGAQGALGPPVPPASRCPLGGLAHLRRKSGEPAASSGRSPGGSLRRGSCTVSPQTRRLPSAPAQSGLCIQALRTVCACVYVCGAGKGVWVWGGLGVSYSDLCPF